MTDLSEEDEDELTGHVFADEASRVMATVLARCIRYTERCDEQMTARMQRKNRQASAAVREQQIYIYTPVPYRDILELKMYCFMFLFFPSKLTNQVIVVQHEKAVCTVPTLSQYESAWNRFDTVILTVLIQSLKSVLIQPFT